MDLNRVLVLSPHTDDGELGAGGTIARWIGEGKDIYYVAFSTCEKSVPDNWPRDILKKECRCAMKTLGISLNKLILLDYEIRSFPNYRQEILDNLIKLKKDIKPHVVITPSSTDVHQDHNTIYQETIRAFKKEASIWGYEHPWNNPSFRTDIFVKLERRHLKKKLDALKCYESQSNKGYFDSKYIRSLAFTRGVQVDIPYAETFELVRLLV